MVRDTGRTRRKEGKYTIEAYIEWKAAMYFAGVAVMAIIILTCILIGGLVWICRMMCRSREKRLEKMMKEWEEQDKEGSKEE